MMKLRKLIILPLLLFFFFACKERERGLSHSILNKWNGKEVIFPKKAIFTRLIADTADFCFSKHKMKILVYADTTDCMGCKLQLDKWKDFMMSLKSISKDTIPFLFFFYPKDRGEMEYLIQSENFDYPVCIDSDDQLNKLNQFSSDVTFLLDESNRVIAAGNPALDPDAKNLYMEMITGKKNVSNSIKTTFEIEQTNIDLGTFKKSDVKTVAVKVKNTGSAPLVIIDINTSCGCIAASFDKQPIRPGNITIVKLKVTPNEVGFMKKTVNIKANTDSPMVINLKGNVSE